MGRGSGVGVPYFTGTPGQFAAQSDFRFETGSRLMDVAKLSRGVGACAVVTGAVWILNMLVTAAQPAGCIGDEACSLPGASLRPNPPYLAALSSVTLVLFVCTSVGLVLLAYRRGRLGRTGKSGAALTGFGVVWLCCGLAVQALWPDAGDDLMPGFVVPGVMSLLLGVLLIAIAVIRSGLLPRWVGVLLIASAVIGIGVNGENWRILLLVPLGAALLVAGVVLWTRADRAPSANSVTTTTSTPGS